MSQNKEEFKLPAWAVPVAVSAFVYAISFYGVFSVARADVENLKTENVEIKENIKKLTEAVTAIPYMKEDIRTMKDQQNEIRTEQMNFQRDIQRDIKTLLQRK